MNGVLVIGNESHGISKQIQSLVSHRITIPSAIPGEQGRAESLNASLATGIFCYEINRQRHLK
jgi:TrmH family RNA methyltransferase